MLEQMREQTGSLIIWVLFAIIIAAFVLFFGSPSDSLGCGSTNNYSIAVEDEPVSDHSWRYAYNGIPLIHGNVPSDQRRPLALEFLLQREILAQAAEKMDFRISDALVDKAIANGEFYLLGNKLDGTRFYFDRADEESDPFFSYDLLTNHALGVLHLPNVQAYKKEQRRGMLAHLMKQELLRSAYVSKEEARDAFIQRNTTISADYVKFETLKYRSGIKLSEAQVNDYVGNHEDELKTKWEQVKPRWESEKARVKARIIKVTRAQSVAPIKDIDPDKAPDDEAEAPAETSDTPDEARIAIDAAREKLVAGSSFAEIAAETSSDRTASLGGLIGWRSAESMGYGQEVVDGSKDLEIGKVSEVIESKGAYFLVLIEERSNKALSFEQKKFDLAVRATPAWLASDLAKAAAEAALASAATSPLSELFSPAPAAPGGVDLNNLPPEILDKLSPEQLQQFMNNAAQGGETGAIVIEGPTQYAQLGGEEAGATKPAKPAATAEPVAAPASAPIDVVNAAIDPAVATSEVAPPSLKSTQGTTRNGDFIAGLGRSDELVADLFGTLAIGDLGSKVYKLKDDEGYVIVQLTDRSEADMEKFAGQAAELQAVLGEAKGGLRMQDWILERCLALKKAGSIQANPAMLRSSDEKLLAYEPCSLMTQGQ
ncbi:MAG: hypothetical protein GY811_16675 [Myxococcales bacterium]|nr:hypothetical protein [Myxococcales bacterium]